MNILVLLTCEVLLIGLFNGMWSFASQVINGICKIASIYPDTKWKYKKCYIRVGNCEPLAPLVNREIVSCHQCVSQHNFIVTLLLLMY